VLNTVVQRGIEEGLIRDGKLAIDVGQVKVDVNF